MTTTHHISFQRGRTHSFSRVVRDPDTRQARDLTASVIYLAVRPNPKADPVVKLTSDATPPATWRTGVVIADQDDYPGKYTVTFVPDDTTDLPALGHDDPYVYDVVVVDPGFGTLTDVDLSNLDLYVPSTVVP